MDRWKTGARAETNPYSKHHVKRKKNTNIPIKHLKHEDGYMHQKPATAMAVGGFDITWLLRVVSFFIEMIKQLVRFIWEVVKHHQQQGEKDERMVGKAGVQLTKNGKSKKEKKDTIVEGEKRTVATVAIVPEPSGKRRGKEALNLLNNEKGMSKEKEKDKREEEEVLPIPPPSELSNRKLVEPRNTTGTGTNENNRKQGVVKEGRSTTALQYKFLPSQQTRRMSTIAREELGIQIGRARGYGSMPNAQFGMLPYPDQVNSLLNETKAEKVRGEEAGEPEASVLGAEKTGEVATKPSGVYLQGLSKDLDIDNDHPVYAPNPTQARNENEKRCAREVRTASLEHLLRMKNHRSLDDMDLSVIEKRVGEDPRDEDVDIAKRKGSSLLYELLSQGSSIHLEALVLETPHLFCPSPRMGRARSSSPTTKYMQEIEEVADVRGRTRDEAATQGAAGGRETGGTRAGIREVRRGNRGRDLELINSPEEKRRGLLRRKMLAEPFYGQKSATLDCCFLDDVEEVGEERGEVVDGDGSVIAESSQQSMRRTFSPVIAKGKQRINNALRRSLRMETAASSSPTSTPKDKEKEREYISPPKRESSLKRLSKNIGPILSRKTLKKYSQNGRRRDEASECCQKSGGGGAGGEEAIWPGSDWEVVVDDSSRGTDGIAEDFEVIDLDRDSTSNGGPVVLLGGDGGVSGGGERIASQPSPIDKKPSGRQRRRSYHSMPSSPVSISTSLTGIFTTGSSPSSSDTNATTPTCSVSPPLIPSLGSMPLLTPQLHQQRGATAISPPASPPASLPSSPLMMFASRAASLPFFSTTDFLPRVTEDTERLIQPVVDLPPPPDDLSVSERLDELVWRMVSGEGGLVRSKRHYGMKRFKKTFDASELAVWLKTELVLSSKDEQMNMLVNQLISYRLLHWVAGPNNAGSTGHSPVSLNTSYQGCSTTSMSSTLMMSSSPSPSPTTYSLSDGGLLQLQWDNELVKMCLNMRKIWCCREKRTAATIVIELVEKLNKVMSEYKGRFEFEKDELAEVTYGKPYHYFCLAAAELQTINLIELEQEELRFVLTNIFYVLSVHRMIEECGKRRVKGPSKWRNVGDICYRFRNCVCSLHDIKNLLCGEVVGRLSGCKLENKDLRFLFLLRGGQIFCLPPFKHLGMDRTFIPLISAELLDKLLEELTQYVLQSEISFNYSKREVRMPGEMRLHYKKFGGSEDDVLKFVMSFFNPQSAEFNILSNFRSKGNYTILYNKTIFKC